MLTRAGVPTGPCRTTSPTTATTPSSHRPRRTCLNLAEGVTASNDITHDIAPFPRDDGSPFHGIKKRAATFEPASTPSTSTSITSTRDDASYILSTFPIIQRQDQAQFDGRYRTKDLILAYMNALAAGDTESQVAV